jgi:hypothetical protein
MPAGLAAVDNSDIAVEDTFFGYQSCARKTPNQRWRPAPSAGRRRIPKSESAMLQKRQAPLSDDVGCVRSIWSILLTLTSE